MGNKLKQELNKQAVIQFKEYAKLVQSDKFKPVPKQIKFKDQMSQKVYDITKDYTVLILKQYVLVEKYLNAAKKKHIIINDKNINQMVSEWKMIKTKILPKFNGSRESFASYVAFEKVGLASLHKKGLSQVYEVTLKQYQVLAKQIKELKQVIKKKLPEMKQALNESTEVLTEANVKQIILAPLNLIKKAFLKVIRVLIEGWTFIIKHLGKLAKAIRDQINKLLQKFDNMIGRVVRYLIKGINPSFFETLSMIGASEDDVAEIIGSQIRKGITVIIAFFTGAGFVQSAVITFYATTTILNKLVTAGEYAEITDTIMNVLDELNSEYFDDLMKDL